MRTVQARLSSIGVGGFDYLYPMFVKGNPATDSLLRSMKKDKPEWKSEEGNRTRISNMRMLKKEGKLQESLEYIGNTTDPNLIEIRRRSAIRWNKLVGENK